MENRQLRLQRVQELEVATTLQAWKDQRRQPRRDIPSAELVREAQRLYADQGQQIPETEIEVVLPDALPNGLAEDHQVTINGIRTTVASIDTERNVVAFLGSPNILKHGLNIVELGVDKIIYWMEKTALSRF